MYITWSGLYLCKCIYWAKNKENKTFNAHSHLNFFQWKKWRVALVLSEWNQSNTFNKVNCIKPQLK